MDRLVIRGCLVLADADNAARAADILVEDGKVAELLEPGTPVVDAEDLDAAGTLAHPGLVNAHMHAHTPLTKGMADRWSLEVLLAAGLRIYGRQSDEDRYTATMVGAAELLLKGCTTVYDMCLEGPLPTVEGIGSIARAYADAGMRAVIAPMTSDRSFFEATPGLMQALPEEVQRELAQRRPAPGSASVDAVRRILREWSFDRDWIRPALAPTIPLHCSDEHLLACKALAQEFGVGMQMHLQESKVQALSGVTRYHRTQTHQLDALGLLNPGFVAAHGVWLDDDEMQRLGRAGASVSHNPGSNMILGSGLADVRRMLDHGINVSIGTDGANCSDNLNMYESMRTALRVSHVRGPDLTRWLSPREVFRAATVGGARAAGFEGLGRIARGCPADLVLLDLSHPNWMPVNDVLVQLLQSEDGSAVRSVMVGGRWAVRDRKLQNIRLAQLREDAAAASRRLLQAGQANQALYQRLLPVVQCFCPALMRQPYRVNRFGSADTS